MEITVNNQVKEVDVDGDTPLLWVLREQLQLTGTKFGCGMAQCGVCTVHVEGIAVRSCVVPISEVAGKEITTIEGLSENGQLHPVQRAWVDERVPQCGYCQCGQIMSAVALLQAVPRPTDRDINQAMSGNLCRCGTYPRIKSAIKRAAANMSKESK